MVLRHYLDLSEKEAADTLGVSVGTVKSHINHLYAKLNLHSRVQAAVYAVENGLDKLERD